MIGADMVSKASPDRYSLLLSSICPMAINASLYKMPYDIVNDFAPVTYTGNVANLLVLRPTLPAMAERLSAADVRSKPARRKSGVIS